jgi:hypothetical protein
MRLEPQPSRAARDALVSEAAAGDPLSFKGSSRQVRRAEAGGRQARPMYSPVRVSMRTFSPSLMKRGTLMILPVSRVAGF